jgi:C4-dicarboxylate transporter DctM subunit
MIVNLETALLSQPIGLIVYVLPAIRGEAVNVAVKKVWHFFTLMLILLTVVIDSPVISTFLPNIVYGASYDEGIDQAIWAN